MKKDEVKKIEEEIKQKTIVPDEIKGKIKKEIFVNVIISITVMIYFSLLILGSLGKFKNIRPIDVNMFSILALGVAIFLFEKSYRKVDGKIALFGIEALAIAIFTLFLPYILFELDKFNKTYYLMINAYVSMYYIIKSLIISLRIKKEYIKRFSDIKDIVKKEKKIYKDTDDSKQPKDEIQETITEKKDNDTKKDIEDNDNTKIKVSTEKIKKETNVSKKNEVINKKKEENIKEKTDKPEAIENTPKKRGRPKKEETLKREVDKKSEKTVKKVEKTKDKEILKNGVDKKSEKTVKKTEKPKEEEKLKKEVDKKLEETPKKRGRPKKEETLKKELENNVEETPKKRGRPRKVVTNND